MVTDTGGINDRSFNASAWKGMQDAAAANSQHQGRLRAVQARRPTTSPT